MKTYFLQVIFVFLVSVICLTDSTNDIVILNSDKILDPYIKEFIMYRNLYYKDCWDNRHIDISVGDISKVYPDVPIRAVGVCNTITKRVIVDYRFIKYANEYELETVVFHELGHCYLYRDHIETTYSDGRPTSMMNPYVLDSNDYREHRQAYIYELFDNAFCN